MKELGLKKLLLIGGLMGLTRLDKSICDAGLASRSEARKLILSGRVSVDGTVVSAADSKIDTECVSIRVDGKLVSGNSRRYFMLNKPEGFVTATEDKREKTVLDLLPTELKRLKLFPVGRLDKDTTGLLILTNDGEFCHKVTSPKKHISKLYEFYCSGSLDTGDIDAFEKGVELKDGSKCLPSFLKIDADDPCHGYLTIFEGQYHQVKRMLASRAKPVHSLKRIAMGELVLDTALTPGEFKELTENDIKLIVNKNVTD
ncbi:MAG: rRNA pseudouridine synthase [Clostridia bacterium]|nr:rRNA pseudouridine synthase [Clostridia bacterium]